MPPKDVTPLARFILSYLREHELTMTQLAGLMGVTHTSISRLLKPGSTVEPTITFLAKLSQATGTDICALVALIAPKATLTNPEAQMIAARISRLPPDKRELVESFLVALSLKASK